ncbi:MAG: class I SAM-dependent methyltransferase [Pseudomonadota bacterium]
MTEESQHFSGTFNAFAVGLVQEIADRYDLRGKLTVEIGCGKGDFLRELVKLTGSNALGIDPGFIDNRASKNVSEIDFLRADFDPADVVDDPDFIVCRHTLEHIQKVGKFIADVASLCDRGRDVSTFFETPDIKRVLQEGAFWDVYYEHCSYFSQGSHARLFRRYGLSVTDLRLDYYDQYIIQYTDPAGSAELEHESDLAEIRSLAKQFPDKVKTTRENWTSFLKSEAEDGRRVVLWGGGSKAVAFLTTNNISHEVGDVVDINPFKQGKFLPGTGHRVLGPEALRDNPPDTVIVMNSVYLDEIGATLRDLGLNPKVVGL